MKSQFTRFALLFAMGALSLALLAACSSDDDGDDATTEPTAEATEAGDRAKTTIKATLSEFTVALDSASAPAGEVTFETENAGTLSHELVVVRSDEDPGSLAVDGDVVAEDGLDVIGEIEEFAAGTSDTGTFVLDAGNYILFCNVAGHYQGGMFTAFTVE